MDTFRLLLLDIWREVCRHLKIDESADTIMRILTHRMPVDRLELWAFDWERNQAESLVSQILGHHSNSSRLTRTLRSRDVKLLQGWIRHHEVLLHHPGDDLHAVVELLMGTQIDGSWLVAPLDGEQGVWGAVLLRAQPPDDFGDEHVQMMQSLIEPFSVALENDRRLHELTALREAAEADKRSALSKLGRDELIDSIVGHEGGLRAVMDRVSLVAQSDLPVLLLGETGTGKEVIARRIHDQSLRAKGPFIRVNCGAIPSDLIDSELFGHEKGAFTGATGLRRGWFERADEGTLLLDEIGELPLPAQVRLLRVLQEGSFDRVGGEAPMHVNVRIIAATHRDLPAMVQEKRFREDLWYRIASFPIVLPPLRERREDIGSLAIHFAERASRRFGLRQHLPTQRDIDLMGQYDWPGNIRELASVIDRAAILGNGERLEIAKALGGNWHAAGASQSVPPSRSHDQASVSTLDDAMRQHIQRTLAQTHGTIEGRRGAAKLLGINPHTLRARMRKLNIDWQVYRN
jgi:transcriptional regulator with GAF, ATPase, and Fis domain